MTGSMGDLIAGGDASDLLEADLGHEFSWR